MRLGLRTYPVMSEPLGKTVDNQNRRPDTDWQGFRPRAVRPPGCRDAPRERARRRKEGRHARCTRCRVTCRTVVCACRWLLWHCGDATRRQGTCGDRAGRLEGEGKRRRAAMSGVTHDPYNRTSGGFGRGESSVQTPLTDSAERALWGEEAATVTRCGEGPTVDRSQHDSPAILRTQHGPTGS